MPPEPLIILGASTRAAAQSAVRAGIRPICADRFADEDLFETAEVLPLSGYPRGLVAAVAAFRGAAARSRAIPWIYTGALENHPGLLSKLSQLGPLYGNPAEVVRRVRNPVAVARALAEAGLPNLAVCRSNQPPPRDGRWLIKPRRGAGGRGIHVWDRSAADVDAGRAREPHYFQQRMAGVSHSALFLATARRATFVGASRQLVGEAELNARPFAYCGSIGPVEVDEALRTQMVRCGEVIAAQFGLRGLFGLDFVVDEDSTAWLTEVNPRYTASVEVLESALGWELLGDHIRACADDDFKPQSPGPPRRQCGKAVVYAPFTFRSPSLAGLRLEPVLAGSGARLADRPRPGTLVPAGAPVCSVIIGELPLEAGGNAAPLDLYRPVLRALLAGLEPARLERDC
jgi:predicted ATP-grasp superfamily ATP-dependent carboligase